MINIEICILMINDYVFVICIIFSVFSVSFMLQIDIYDSDFGVS